MKKSLIVIALVTIFFFVSCGGSGKSEPAADGDNETPDEDETTDEEGVTDTDLTGSVFSMPKMNPSGNIPLSAAVPMKSAGVAKVTVEVADIDGKSAPFKREYTVSEEAAENVEIPVLGLFPAHKNKVTVAALDASGKAIDEKTFEMAAKALPKDFPAIEMSGKIDSGWTMVNWLRT
ncbi:arylsulfate sulfotransferase N-terminal domain-containing protein, partial [bacterium]|nr:arylsulfate sulfotransferase N-terminal domain-containing protein [bacterium]